jgi:hypothetical protein
MDGAVYERSGGFCPGLRASFKVEPHTATGCGHCHDMGALLEDDFDGDGPFISSAECPECHGSGERHCSADGCTRPVSRRVLGPGGERVCCDHAACLTEAVLGACVEAQHIIATYKREVGA